MSDTPKTDAQPRMWENRNMLASYESVPADFARGLERENHEMRKRLQDALPILREYARKNPRWLAADMQVHDPNGVNGLIEEVESILSNAKADL